MDESEATDGWDDEHIGVSIVEKISSIAGVDSCELDTRLYDVVDPDALSRVIRSGGPEIQVSFRFETYQVSVFGSGEIVVTDPSTDTS